MRLLRNNKVAFKAAAQGKGLAETKIYLTWWHAFKKILAPMQIQDSNLCLQFQVSRSPSELNVA